MCAQRVDTSSGGFAVSDGNNTLMFPFVLFSLYLLPFQAETVLRSLPRTVWGREAPGVTNSCWILLEALSLAMEHVGIALLPL